MGARLDRDKRRRLRTPRLTGSCSTGPPAPFRTARASSRLPTHRTTRSAPGVDGATGALSFPSALHTRYPENNTVHALYFEAKPRPASAARRARPDRRAVLVLPQWNAGPDGHVGLCRLLNRFGLSALRLTLPYHDARRPAELNRADYIVSANVGRTLQACRQAVMDARRAVGVAREPGLRPHRHPRHEPRLVPLAADRRARAAHSRAGAQPHLAVLCRCGVARPVDHARASGARGIGRARSARQMWLPISPQVYLDRIRDKKTLLVYARYDLTFPVDLSRELVGEFQRRGIPHELAVLPCGHYSTGVTPFKYLDGFVLARFLDRNL